MEESILPRVILLVILLGFSAFFAACEVTFFSLHPAQLAALKKDKGPTGELINRLLQNPRKLLVTIYIGNEFVNIAISALATSIALKLFGNVGVAVAIGVGTFVILLFGEVIPKSLSLRFAERFALLAASPLNLFSQWVQPIQELFTGAAEAVLSRVGFFPKEKNSTISDEEFRTMVELGEGEGIIEADERELIHNVIEFGDKTVRDVMTPKIDMVTLSVNDKMEDILPKILKNFYSRIPVHDTDGETIAGILLTKDWNRFRHLPSEGFNLKGVLQPPISVPETKKIKDLLQDFKKLKRHMAIVLNEYGSVAGLVTMEDILEELVGEIDSEMRKEESPLVKISDKRYRMLATYGIEEFNETFDCKLPNGDIHTVGGFVFSLFGRVPRSGETISYEHFKFRVDKMKGTRILSLHLSLSNPKPAVAELPEETPQT